MFRKYILGLAILLVLSACNQVDKTPSATLPEQVPSTTLPASPMPATGTPTPTATVTLPPLPSATQGPVVYGPTNFPQGINPLTGLAVADSALLERRPLAYKINLVPRDYYRPPWGLSLADIVYDYYHNAGYSRLHAIFYGQEAELVGAIRSGRLLDQELVRMYQSIFAYGSADEMVNKRLLNAEYAYRVFLEGQAAPCPPTAATGFCRWEPNSYDLLLSSTSALSQYASNKGVDNNRQNLDGMSFNSDTPTGGIPGTQLYVRYSGDNYTRWDYDPTSGSYLRFQDAVYDQGAGEEYAPLIDRLSNE